MNRILYISRNNYFIDSDSLQNWLIRSSILFLLYRRLSGIFSGHYHNLKFN